jgi:cytidylate kinase
VNGIIVAIDGPAASGKSTTARRVAQRLGYSHLNSGLLYRTIAWLGLRDGWIDDANRFADELEELRITMERRPPGFVVRVNGEFPGAVLAASQTAVRASHVAARGDVRECALGVLRAAGMDGGIACDGRDIGTIVFPGAALKIFLVASAEERARRRVEEQGIEPDRQRLELEMSRLRERDDRDSARDLAPLRRAPDAIEIDTTRLTPDDVVDEIVVLAIDRGARIVDDICDSV